MNTRCGDEWLMVKVGKKFGLGLSDLVVGSGSWSLQQSRHGELVMLSYF